MKKSRNFSDLLEIATTVCRKAGYPINEIEYESAINSAIGDAVVRYGSHEPTTLYCSAALHECAKVKLMFDSWQRQDAAGAGRGLCEKAIPTPIPLLDFEVLSFVARHGRTRAARMLSLNVPKLNDLLHDITRRINHARDLQLVP